MTRPIPTGPMPVLDVPLVGGDRFVLSESPARNFTLLAMYRGYHCPICMGQLKDLQERLERFSEKGVECIAVSMDPEDRAMKSVEEWGLDKLCIGYAMPEETARAFGLYISSSIREQEPDVFSEPGLFLVRPDNTLYFVSIQSAPFTRPPLDELLMGIGYAVDHHYPARGDVAG